jgi:hypothetical protein
MASHVAEVTRRLVKVLRGSPVGHIHSSLTTLGRWEDGDKADPICLLLWKDLLWKCDPAGQAHLVVQRDLPSFLDGREATAGGLIHTLGFIPQGQSGVTDLSTVAAVWHGIQAGIPHTVTHRKDYGMIAVSTNLKVHGTCRMDTIQIVSKRSEDGEAIVRVTGQGYTSLQLAVAAMEQKAVRLFNQRQMGTMIHILEPDE